MSGAESRRVWLNCGRRIERIGIDSKSEVPLAQPFVVPADGWYLVRVNTDVATISPVSLPLGISCRQPPTLDELEAAARRDNSAVVEWIKALIASGKLNGRDGFPGPTPTAGRGLRLNSPDNSLSIDEAELRKMVTEQLNVIERLAGLDDV